MGIRTANAEWRLSKPGILCAGLVMLAILLCRFLSGPAAPIFLRADIAYLLPPLWLQSLLSLLVAFLQGYGAGMVIQGVASGRQSMTGRLQACRGGICFVALIFSEILRHPLYFSCGRPFIAFLITVGAMLLAVLCAYFWYSVSPIAALIEGSCTLWLFFLAMQELVVALCI